jgi:hypothetical protein
MQTYRAGRFSGWRGARLLQIRITSRSVCAAGEMVNGDCDTPMLDDELNSGERRTLNIEH